MLYLHSNKSKLSINRVESLVPCIGLVSEISYYSLVALYINENNNYYSYRDRTQLYNILKQRLIPYKSNKRFFFKYILRKQLNNMN